jgi:hypothetical protein
MVAARGEVRIEITQKAFSGLGLRGYLQSSHYPSIVCRCRAERGRRSANDFPCLTGRSFFAVDVYSFKLKLRTEQELVSNCFEQQLSSLMDY